MGFVNLGGQSALRVCRKARSKFKTQLNVAVGAMVTMPCLERMETCQQSNSFRPWDGTQSLMLPI
jgi:hypothetical protein